MNSFHEKTRHPVTGEIEFALWIDDCFGRHRYGVRFPSDNSLWRENADRTLIRATPPDQPKDSANV